MSFLTANSDCKLQMCVYRVFVLVSSAGSNRRAKIHGKKMLSEDDYPILHAMASLPNCGMMIFPDLMSFLQQISLDPLQACIMRLKRNPIKKVLEVALPGIARSK